MKKEIDGVTVDAKSIVTALEIIRQVCEDNITDDCESCAKTCPFGYGETTCCVRDLIPCNWKINSDEPVWRALL